LLIGIYHNNCTIPTTKKGLRDLGIYQVCTCVRVCMYVCMYVCIHILIGQLASATGSACCEILGAVPIPNESANTVRSKGCVFICMYVCMYMYAGMCMY